MRYLFCLLIIVTTLNCHSKKIQVSNSQTDRIKVELTTTKGIVLLELSNKTPLHRDNFLKIVKEGRLDSMIFHRVLEDFVVQAGEYDALKSARMDASVLEKLDYTIPGEFDATLFHKRGALGAARTDNPARASGPLSFYIVQRGARTDSLIKVDETRINGWLQKHYFLNAPQNKNLKAALLEAEREGNGAKYSSLQDTIRRMAKLFDHKPYVIPEHHREVYRTLGGSPHLDQNYTIFGEVISGMEVVDAIAVVKVKGGGRPLENVYILKAKIVD